MRGYKLNLKGDKTGAGTCARETMADKGGRIVAKEFENPDKVS